VSIHARGPASSHRPGKPVQNAHIESFHGRFRDECLSESWFLTVMDARWIIEAWRQDYNALRPHGALGDRTPEEFERLFQNQERRTQEAAQKEERCSMPPTHVSLAEPEGP
jgi:transposase InsO family protein